MERCSQVGFAVPIPTDDIAAATKPGLSLKRLKELDLNGKQIKDLLGLKTWTAQEELLDKAIQFQAAIGKNQHDDFNEFEVTLKQAIKDARVELDAKQEKQIIAAVRWTNPDAEPVIKKVISRLGDSPGSAKSLAIKPGLSLGGSKNRKPKPTQAMVRSSNRGYRPSAQLWRDRWKFMMNGLAFLSPGPSMESFFRVIHVGGEREIPESSHHNRSCSNGIEADCNMMSFC